MGEREISRGRERVSNTSALKSPRCKSSACRVNSRRPDKTGHLGLIERCLCNAARACARCGPPDRAAREDGYSQDGYARATLHRHTAKGALRLHAKPASRRGGQAVGCSACRYTTCHSCGWLVCCHGFVRREQSLNTGLHMSDARPCQGCRITQLTPLL